MIQLQSEPKSKTWTKSHKQVYQLGVLAFPKQSFCLLAMMIDKIDSDEQCMKYESVLVVSECVLILFEGLQTCVFIRDGASNRDRANKRENTESA